MINEFIFALFHHKEYGVGFLEKYKQIREVKKINREINKQQKIRRRLLNLTQKK